LTAFIANNKKLRHLNLQAMHLSFILEIPPKVLVVEPKVKEEKKD
jgi:hypothetical protein